MLLSMPPLPDFFFLLLDDDPEVAAAAEVDDFEDVFAYLALLLTFLERSPASPSSAKEKPIRYSSPSKVWKKPRS